jgi:phosphatidylinositol-3,4,5-trisphosphate 3-phosphatase and dual-specificity protein phosphatase PTEN
MSSASSASAASSPGRPRGAGAGSAAAGAATPSRGPVRSGGSASDRESGADTDGGGDGDSDSDSDASTPARRRGTPTGRGGGGGKDASSSSRSLSAGGGGGSSSKKLLVKKVDAFSFNPGNQGYDRGAANPWGGHDPAVRLALDLRPRPSYCISLKSIRSAVSKKKKRFIDGDFDLDLAYITPKIIAMGFPSVGREGLYRNPMPEVQRFFEKHHAGRYRIYNLCSERAYDPTDFLGRVARYPFDDHNPCPLHLIAAFCDDVDSWLTTHPDNVVAVHCKAGKGRTGLMIAAYLVHCGFKAAAEQALKWFGVQRTSNAKGVTIPSQMRFVHYYEAILRQGFPVTYTYRVQHIRIRGVPAVEMGGGCAPWFQLLVDGAKVFDYKKAVGGAKNLLRFKKGEPYMDLDLTAYDVRVANNVKLQLLHEGVTGTVKVCHLWFHTGFVTRNYLVFGKGVIDKACKDKKGTFPKNFAIEFFLTRVEANPLSPGDQEAAAAAARAAAAAAVLSSSSGGGGTSSGGGYTSASGDDGAAPDKRRKSLISSGISMRLLSPKGK